MKNLFLVNKEDLREEIHGIAKQSWQEGYEAALNRYIYVSEAALIAGVSPQQIYRNIKNKRYQNVIEEEGKPVRILRSDVINNNNFK